jgi:DNA mismatch repair protein MutL
VGSHKVFYIDSMAITALPEATVRMLGSSQVLTTPTSLIKELVDNALDAKATAVDIFTSPDTLSKLEVRDNGHGITQEDLDALGRRGHTSKLRTFEELTFVGGHTLGFRGEALASAVQLGDVSVTTKTDGESVATLVKLNSTGGIKTQSRGSHPVGTTVTVVNFASTLPVRKKTFEKEAPRTIQAIRRLLEAYALARPSVRFSLKVTKNGKGSWLYAPRINDGIGETVSQVVGRETSAQCIEKSLQFSDLKNVQEYGDNSEGITQRDAALNNSKSLTPCGIFCVEAFLPRPGTTASTLGKGQYISIDSRPVSHEKGTMKKV